MVKKLYSRTNIEFITKMMGVFESFRHRGQPYLAYLQSRERNDEFLMRDNLVKPLFQALGYDQQQDFSPEETIVSGRIDTTIRNGQNHPIIVIETQSSLLKDLTEHRNRLFIYTEEVDARFAVLTDGVSFEAWECPGRGKARFLRVSLDFQALYSKFLKKGMEGLSESDIENVLKLKFLSKEVLFVREEELYKEPELHVSDATFFAQLIDDLQDAMGIVKSDIVTQFEVRQGEWKEYQDLIAKAETQRVYPSEFKKYERSKHAIESYNDWQKVSPGANSGSEELFCTETMYILFNRLLLIRICEDKGLTTRQISNGGIQTWLSWKGFMEFKKANYTELLESAYKTMNRVYPHLFRTGIFDWYLPDSDIILRILFIFNRYNFKNVDRDVLGKLYERYIDKEERKRLGQFYTPEEVIDYILETVGYTPENEIEGKKLLDPACGSGGFLVRAVKALVERYQRRNVPAEIILNRVCESIYGFDINPFAAHLVEMNLLFQVIDLINEAKKANPDFNMEKFNIFVTDSLRIPKGEGQGELPLEWEQASEYIEDAEIVKQIKLKQGDFSEGFDFVVGNPPYLKANAPQQEVLTLRRQIEKQNYFETLFEKWDLYVPFIEFGFKAAKEGGWFSFIVSDAYRTADYAQKSRGKLLEESTVAQLDFFPGLRLFDEPQVENCIFALQKTGPIETDEVKRIKHLDEKDLHKYEVLKVLRQLEAKEKIFYPEEREELLIQANVIPLENICYISKGMVLNSDEKRWKGEFDKEDLISNVKTDIHCKPYIEGKDISRYRIERVRFLEWGTDRVPPKVSRPTFPELHENEKIIVGKTSGVTTDNSKLYCDQSVVIFVPWHRLVGVENKTLKRAEIQRKVREFSELSKEFSLRYIVALLNSEPSWSYFWTNICRKLARSICPDDWRIFPIALASQETQVEFAALVDQMLEINKKLPDLEKLAGTLPELIKLHNIQTKDLADCPDAMLIMEKEVIGKPTIKREQGKVYIDRKSYIECTDDNLANYLELYINSIKNGLRGRTKTDLHRLLQVPTAAEGVEAILAKQEALLKEIEDLKQRHIYIDHQIDQKVYKLYGLIEKETELVKESNRK